MSNATYHHRLLQELPILSTIYQNLIQYIEKIIVTQSVVSEIDLHTLFLFHLYKIDL